MKYKICLIAFNFGKLPSYFDLWLKSAERNENFDFLLFIDDYTEYNFPSNVFVQYITFQKYVEKIQKKFDFDLVIPNPYKLCDFRPAFGEIFEEEIIEYDFWGTIDFDIILGEINNFISDEILDNYDKILTRDHFCLYRNTYEVNRHYKGKQELGENIYKKVFKLPYVIAFGERGKYGVYQIWKYNHWRMYDEPIIGDILPGYYHFEYKVENYKRERAIFFFQNEIGRVYAVIENKNRKFFIKELMYIHLQKRKMIDTDSNRRRKYCVVIPNKIISCDFDDKKLFFIINKIKFKKYIFFDIIKKYRWKLYKIRCNTTNKFLKLKYKRRM